MDYPYRSACYIVDLPLDTFFHIFLCLDPHDILCLRRCCKKLAAVTHERMVWLNALKRFCFIHRICLATFPRDKISTLEIQHTVTSPSRFVGRLLRELPTDAIQPQSMRTISLPQRMSVMEFATLATGGRFLITVSRAGELAIWDLGFNPANASGVEENPVVTRDMGGYVYNIFTQPTIDGLGLLILTITRIPSVVPLYTQLDVFEIYPHSSFELHRLASWRFAPGALALDRCRISFYEQYVAAIYHHSSDLRPTVLVWNYAQNTAVKWQAVSGYVDGERDELVLHNGHIAWVATGIFILWKLPPLHPRIPGSEVQAEPQLSSLELEHDGYPIQYAHLPPRIPSVAHLDIIQNVSEGNGGLETLKVLHHHLQPPPVNQSPSLEPDLRILGILGTTAISIQFKAVPLPSSSGAWVSEREMVMFQAEQGGYLVRATAIRLPSAGQLAPSTDHSQGGASNQSATGIIWTGPAPESVIPSASLQTLRYTYCAVSGRLVIVHDDKLRVMDYLGCPKD